MEPVIPKAKNLLEQMAEEEKKATTATKKFSASLSAVEGDAGDDGWGSEGDWGGDE